MDLKEAMEIIEERDPALGIVLRDIMDKYEQVQHSQIKVIEALVLHLATSKDGGMDLSFIDEMLKNR